MRCRLSTNAHLSIYLFLLPKQPIRPSLRRLLNVLVSDIAQLLCSATVILLSCRPRAEVIAGTNAARSAVSLPEGITLKIKLLSTILVLGATLAAASTAQAQMTQDPTTQRYTYHVNVTSRTIKAVNYRHRDGATKLDFAGTDLMPNAKGEAKIESKKGYIEIEVEFGGLESPTTFGGEYLTYILWAISPEGRAMNLGEVLVGENHRSKLDVTTDLQAFALVVTAEPYYAVRQPSNVVVIENVVREDTKGAQESVSAKYELLERGGYIPTGFKFDPVVANSKLPLEFFEARNALRIAQSEGAEKYASSSYQHAVALMDQADGYATRKDIPRQPLVAVSREAVQTAEDARAIAVVKIEEERLASERQNAADTQASIQAQANDANRLKQQAESDAANAQARTNDANRMKEQAEMDAAKAQADAAQAQSETAQAKLNSEKALADSAQAQAEMAARDAASATALAASQADAERSRLAALEAQKNTDQAMTEKAELRSKLAQQLNSILQTRDTARGLIISMSDVLFDTGKFDLKPGAREKLAKVAGILLAYPGLSVQVGGYTDSKGGDEMNQKLSENRAASVRDYLVQQGVGNNSVTAKGFGNSSPVASNDLAAGRQQNRRVELVVSGESIGVTTTATSGTMQ
jgi:outer membrane protein OmpA-like peptidoglycan-associated protein